MSAFLKAYSYSGDTGGYTIEPAPAKRDWMDATPDKFAYHCMPLTLANQSGWVVKCPTTFAAVWDGKTEREGVTLRFSEKPETWHNRISSHFGSGIISFMIPWIFRTQSGWGLMVRGPTNSPKDNAFPLDGLVETDWAPYTFTMNWKIMRRNTEVWFKQGEPICMITPFLLNAPEETVCSFHRMDEDPQLEKDYHEFAEFRLRAIRQHDETGKLPTKRSYMRGRRPDGTPVEEHRTNYKLKSFGPPPA